MPKFFTKIKFVFQYLKALKYAEKGEYQKVINTLEKYRSFLDKNMTNKFSEYYILLGKSYYEVLNYRLAEGYLLSAINHINLEKKLNNDEKKYLNYYTYSFLYFTYLKLYDEIKASQSLKIVKQINYEDKNIRISFLAHFQINTIIETSGISR